MIIFIIQKCRKVNYFVGKKETHHYIQIKTKFWNTLKTPLLVKVRFCAFPVLKGVQKNMVGPNGEKLYLNYTVGKI